MKYSEQGTILSMLLRATPRILHPVVVRLIPAFWRTRQSIAKGRQILEPVIRERQGALQSDTPKPRDFLQWLVEEADENDGNPAKLALRELNMGLASVHLTTMAGLHALYDMCSMPTYFDELRDEIVIVLQEDGGRRKGFTQKLRKMDSFLKESQRLNPASLLSFHRIVKNKPLHLSDGKVLAPGTHVCVAAYEVSKDNRVIAEQEFDGLRYYKMGQDRVPQYAQVDRDHLHFGYGRYACPGRFFASAEVKIILSRLLERYDIRFRPEDGPERPKNVNADEFLFADLTTKLQIRQRKE